MVSVIAKRSDKSKSFSEIRVNTVDYSDFFTYNDDTCELKVCSTKKPDNPTVLLALPAVPELSALCIIRAFALKGGKMLPEKMHECRLRDPPLDGVLW